ncbi:MAG: acyl carrier protein [Gammaproteobacteria bacterium]|nr:acyl carrier protein [Gammaproteobacteria bacterium]
MQTKEQIYSSLQEILEELFEIPVEDISLEANLYQDLDLDSIDSVDLVLKLQDVTGVKVKPEDFKQVRTVQDVVNAVHQLLES